MTTFWIWIQLIVSNCDSARLTGKELTIVWNVQLVASTKLLHVESTHVEIWFSIITLKKKSGVEIGQSWDGIQLPKSWDSTPISEMRFKQSKSLLVAFPLEFYIIWKIGIFSCHSLNLATLFSKILAAQYELIQIKSQYRWNFYLARIYRPASTWCKSQLFKRQKEINRFWDSFNIKFEINACTFLNGNFGHK